MRAAQRDVFGLSLKRIHLWKGQKELMRRMTEPMELRRVTPPFNDAADALAFAMMAGEEPVAPGCVWILKESDDS